MAVGSTVVTIVERPDTSVGSSTGGGVSGDRQPNSSADGPTGSAAESTAGASGASGGTGSGSGGEGSGKPSATAEADSGAGTSTESGVSASGGRHMSVDSGSKPPPPTSSDVAEAEVAGPDDWSAASVSLAMASDVSGTAASAAAESGRGQSAGYSSGAYHLPSDACHHPGPSEVSLMECERNRPRRRLLPPWLLDGAPGGI